MPKIVIYPPIGELFIEEFLLFYVVFLNSKMYTVKIHTAEHVKQQITNAVAHITSRMLQMSFGPFKKSQPMLRFTSQPY